MNYGTQWRIYRGEEVLGVSNDQRLFIKTFFYANYNIWERVCTSPYLVVYLLGGRVVGGSQPLSRAFCFTF